MIKSERITYNPEKVIFCEKTRNDEDHGSACGACEQLVGGDVVVIEPRPIDAPLCFCSNDCAREWLDQARAVEKAEDRVDNWIGRRRAASQRASRLLEQLARPRERP